MAVAGVPAAGIEVPAQLLQARCRVVDAGEGRNRRPRVRIEIGLGSAPVRAQEAVAAVRRDIDGLDLQRAQVAAEGNNVRENPLIERAELLAAAPRDALRAVAPREMKEPTRFDLFNLFTLLQFSARRGQRKTAARNADPLSDTSPWSEGLSADRIDLELLFIGKESLPLGEVQTMPLLRRNRWAVCTLRFLACQVVKAANRPGSGAAVEFLRRGGGAAAVRSRPLAGPRRASPEEFERPFCVPSRRLTCPVMVVAEDCPGNVNGL